MSTSMLVRFLVALVIFVPMVNSGNSQPNGQVLPETFLETFDGAPAQPQPWQPSDWDVTVHSRERRGTTLDPMHAHHGPDCSAPMATHHISSFADAVFICRDHLMTAINGSEYGLIYLTPNALADFSTGEAVIRFDMSTFTSSNRDWVDIWVSPYDQHIQAPLEDWLPDLQGPPRNAVQIRLDQSQSCRFFLGNVYRNYEPQRLATNHPCYNAWLTPDAARRDTFELRISRNRIKFGMPQYNQWMIDTPIADLGWEQGVVQLGHHSYNPTKCDGTCGPNTWHWDNVEIAPAVPFTIIRAAQRSVAEMANNPVFTFPQGAPANARLRFSGFGTNIEVSYDNGATWVTAVRQPAKRNGDDHYRAYWTPIPAGTTSVRVRGQQIANWGWDVRDVSVWAQSSGTVPGVTPTRPPAATPTRPPAATETPEPSATRTAVPTATRTPAPTSALDIYTDELEAGWQDWSWDPITRNLSNAAPVHGGTRSIAVTYTDGWSGFLVGGSTALELAGYDVLRFWIRGSGTPGPIEVRVGNRDDFVRQVITPSPNTWTQVEVPIASLASDGINYVWWQNMSASAQPTVYLDDIAFIDK